MKNKPCFLKRSNERSLHLSRRHFLRGLGACIALPAMESLHPLGALAKVVGTAADSSPVAAPTRMAFVYVPNGIIPSAWWPESGPSENLQISPTLAPLTNIRDKIQLVSGLQDLSANPERDGAGDHARAGGTFLTGVRIKKTAGADLHAGASIDQVVAQQIGHLTRFSSLELTCDSVRKAGDCDSGYSCAYSYNIAWRSPEQPLTPEANPRLVFERLFGSGSPQERANNLRRRQQEERSVLDFVLEDAHAIQKELGGRDRQRLDQYLTGVRELEQRIERTERMTIPNPSADAPAGIPTNFGEHIQLMFDILLLAFQTDSTRVATILIAAEASNHTFPEVGISEGHHNLSHHRNEPEIIEKVKKIDLWYAAQFARFLERLDATKEANGQSLLHNSMIVYGSGNADGNNHTHTNLPILLAGAGGGTLRPGRYVQTSPAPLTNLFLSLADRMGAKGLERHGDSTGRLAII
jgi:hypothetical protein